MVASLYPAETEPSTPYVCPAQHGVPLCVFPSEPPTHCASIGNAHEPAALALTVRRGHTTQLDLGEISWTSEAGHTHTHGMTLSGKRS